MKRFFLFASVIFLISSCASNETADSGSVKQAEIYQTYRISWVSGKGYCSASFRFGGENGTTLRLSDSSKVTMNGQQLSEGKFLFGGAFYEGEQQNYSAKHMYRFTDTDGKIYENGYDFEAVEFVNPPEKISKNENMVLGLSRNITSSENIFVQADEDTISSNSMHVTGDSSNSVYFDASGNKLIIKPDFFQGFKDAPVTIWLYKTDFVKPLKQHGNQEGELHFNFQTESFTCKRSSGKRTAGA